MRALALLASSGFVIGFSLMVKHMVETEIRDREFQKFKEEMLREMGK